MGASDHVQSSFESIRTSPRNTKGAISRSFMLRFRCMARVIHSRSLRVNYVILPRSRSSPELSSLSIISVYVRRLPVPMSHAAGRHVPDDPVTLTEVLAGRYPEAGDAIQAETSRTDAGHRRGYRRLAESRPAGVARRLKSRCVRDRGQIPLLPSRPVMSKSSTGAQLICRVDGDARRCHGTTFFVHVLLASVQ